MVDREEHCILGDYEGSISGNFPRPLDLIDIGKTSLTRHNMTTLRGSYGLN